MTVLFHAHIIPTTSLGLAQGSDATALDHLLTDFSLNSIRIIWRSTGLILKRRLKYLFLFHVYVLPVDFGTLS